MPRISTWEDYQQRIARVTQYIDSHLDDHCSLDHLAGIAAFSPCHFHRVFRAVMSEGVAEYQRRLRLERAARSLRLTANPVVDIALEAGYEAHETFTRAFEVAYGQSPSGYRNERGLAPTRRGNAELPRIHGTVRRIGPLHVVALRHVGPYSEVGETFDRLAAWMGGLFTPHTETLGFCHDDPEVVNPQRLRYDAAFTVDGPVAVTDGVEYRLVPARDYVTAVHAGTYSTLHETYAGLIRGYLLHHSRAIAEDGSLEFFLNSPEGSSAESLSTEVCLPIVDPPFGRPFEV